MKRTGKALLASVLLVVIALLGRYAIAEWYIHRATETAQKSIARIQESSQRQLQVIQDKQAADKEQQRLAALQRQQGEDVEARANAEKEKAWSAFYKERKDCLNWQSDKHMVECVNYKMKERQKFEQQWTLGAVTRT